MGLGLGLGLGSGLANPNPNPNRNPNPNQVGSDKAYEQIDRMQLEICEIEEQAAELQEREA